MKFKNFYTPGSYNAFGECTACTNLYSTGLLVFTLALFVNLSICRRNSSNYSLSISNKLRIPIKIPSSWLPFTQCWSCLILIVSGTFNDLAKSITRIKAFSPSCAQYNELPTISCFRKNNDDNNAVSSLLSSVIYCDCNENVKTEKSKIFVIKVNTSDWKILLHAGNRLRNLGIHF